MSAPKPASRAAQAADVLRQEILAKGPGTRLSSVRELKARLGFSQASLAAAFEQLEREGLIVRRHGSGIYASENVGQVRVAFVMDPKFLLLANRSPVWHLILNALCKAADARNWSYTLQLGAYVPAINGYGSLSPEALPAALLSDLENNRFSGLVGIGLSQGAANVITQYGVRVTALSGYGEAIVEFHHQSLLSQGLLALKEKGAQSVSVVASRAWDLERIDSFAEEFGIEAEGCLLGEAEPAEKPLTSPDPIQLGWQWARDLELKKGAAILSCDDMLAVGIIMGLFSRGLVPGRDLLMATHSNKGSSTLTGWDQCLIRMEYDPQEIADTLLNLVEQSFSKETWSKAKAGSAPSLMYSEGGERIYPIAPHLFLPE